MQRWPPGPKKSAVGCRTADWCLAEVEAADTAVVAELSAKPQQLKAQAGGEHQAQGETVAAAVVVAGWWNLAGGPGLAKTLV